MARKKTYARRRLSGLSELLSDTQEPSTETSSQFWQWILAIDRAVGLASESFRRINDQMIRAVHEELADAGTMGAFEIEVDDRAVCVRWIGADPGLGSQPCPKEPKVPLDTSDPWNPKAPKDPTPPKDPKDPKDPKSMFDPSWWESVILVDRAIGLAQEALQRIQFKVRRTVHSEIANAGVQGHLCLRATEDRFLISR